MEDIIVVHKKFQDVTSFYFLGFNLVEVDSNLTREEIRSLVESMGGDRYITLL